MGGRWARVKPLGEAARERAALQSGARGKGPCSVRGVQASAGASVLRLGRPSRLALTLPCGAALPRRPDAAPAGRALLLGSPGSGRGALRAVGPAEGVAPGSAGERKAGAPATAIGTGRREAAPLRSFPPLRRPRPGAPAPRPSPSSPFRAAPRRRRTSAPRTPPPPACSPSALPAPQVPLARSAPPAQGGARLRRRSGPGPARPARGRP